MNWNNLVKEPGYINRFTRGFCVVAMARALGVSTEAIDATLGKANTEAEAEAEAERANETLSQGQVPTEENVKIVKAACALVHNPPCCFWNDRYGTVPAPVVRVKFGAENVERAEASYGRATKE